MKIYLRKIDQQFIDKQVSYTKDVLRDFLGNLKDHDSINCVGKKSRTQENVTILLATDPRFDNKIKKILADEGEYAVDDLMAMYKNKTDYTVELVKTTDPKYASLVGLFDESDRHVLINSDDITPIPPTIGDRVVYNSGYISAQERNRIIFGAPGTGKSFKLNQDKNSLLHDGGNYERVTFHPDYTYANFVGTYKPVPEKDSVGNDIISYKYVPGPFMRVFVDALKSARSGDPKPFLLIIEEINRAKVAAVFGDVFQLLDRTDDNTSMYAIQASEDMKKYLVDELGGNLSDYNEIKIPDNMFIWATMNSADQGVFPMDTAFKRRWEFTYIGIDENESGISNKYIELGKGSSMRVVEWNQLRKEINLFLSEDCKVNEDKLLGPYFINKKILNLTTSVDGKDMIDKAKFVEVFKSKVLMYLFEDAAKQKRPTLFGGMVSATKYSDVIKAFEAEGVLIFASKISDKFPGPVVAPTTVTP